MPIEYSGEMRWIQRGELPDIIMTISGESSLYTCFLINAAGDKRETEKNEDKSSCLDTSQHWMKQNKVERFGKLIHRR